MFSANSSRNRDDSMTIYRQTLWNAAGLNAFELTFENGKKFRIGTDEPQPLLEAIRAKVIHAGFSK
jgi:hypothetical protein